MTIYSLTPKQRADFASLPEVAMATQIALDEGSNFIVVSSDRIAMRYDEHIERDFARLGEYFADRHVRDIKAYGDRLDAWAAGLPPIEVLEPMPVEDAWQALAFIHLGPLGPLPGIPYRPSYTHGHLPFHGQCGGTDRYYRYEQFPNSKRIDLRTNRVIQKNTYGCPESERDFTPTGLSAVGRFALPLVLPACWRYELTPAPHTKIHYGASVPLYGQSGGAVEVMFPDPFKNVCPIPPPTVLPIL